MTTASSTALTRSAWDPAWDAPLRGLFAAGRSDAAIGAALGCTKCAVWRRRKVLGLITPDRRGGVRVVVAPPGERRWHGLEYVWPAAADDLLRARLAAGWVLRRVAAAFGVSAKVVRRRVADLGLRVIPGPPSFGREHLEAVVSAGWPWPVPHVPADLGPRAVRVLILLLAAPLTKREIVAGLGLRWQAVPQNNLGASGQARRAGRRPLLQDLERRGLVAAVRPGGEFGRQALYCLTASGLQLMEAAAAAVRTPSTPSED